MAQAIGNKWSSTSLSKVPPACAHLMGVWLNGCDEEEGLWLLCSRVLCFVIHLVNSDQDLACVSRLPQVHSSFTSLTFIVNLAPNVNAIDLQTSKDGERLRDVQDDFGIRPPGSMLTTTLADRMRSLPKGQGFEGDTYQDLRLLHLEPIHDNETNRKLLPPLIATVSMGRKWSTWEDETGEDGETYIMKHGQKQDVEEQVYYDRKLCRKIYLMDAPWIPVNYEADVSMFGLPAPNLPFSKNTNHHLAPQPKSEWLYLQEKPDPGTMGKTMVDRVVQVTQKAVLVNDDLDSNDSYINTQSHTSDSPPLQDYPIF
ncbi:hypothetical protein CPB84DRAFT_1854020 [Gymnopilus junonius]|uniref:Uncharacterized protein n=1 Tax=Gymnopilus junonius TaxID=109634 RepID=A0A9P5N910_GYMJU|nr:hypothetical protein CPB84DRAFT_1854020 [Gymnopilus junonius]